MTTVIAVNPEAIRQDALIEAVATIRAAANILDHLAGPDEAVEFNDAAWRLMPALLGVAQPPLDDSWKAEPMYVEVEARAFEIEADVLERRSIDERIATLRAMAPRYREAGTIDLPFEL